MIRPAQKNQKQIYCIKEDIFFLVYSQTAK